jgi:hypothetical protein
MELEDMRLSYDIDILVREDLYLCHMTSMVKGIIRGRKLILKKDYMR